MPIDRIIYLDLGMRLNDIVWQLHLYIWKLEIWHIFFFLLNKEIDKVKYIWNLSRRFLDTIHRGMISALRCKFITILEKPFAWQSQTVY